MEITNAILTKFVAAVGLFTSQVVFAFDVPAGEMTSGRARALVGVAFGLISAVIGAYAYFRSSGRITAIVALVFGFIGLVLGAIHLAISTGGFGTGGGRAGAIVGLVLSVIGIGLGGIIVARSRRSAEA